MDKFLKTASFSVLLALTGATFAAQHIAPPAQDVSARRNPLLADAQQLLEQASAKIDAAQQASHEDLGGHATKARQLIDQANNELRQAATFHDRK